MSTTAQHRARPPGQGPQAGTRLGAPSTPAQSWDTCAKGTHMPGCHRHAPPASITPLCCRNPAQGQVLLDGSQAVPEGHLRTWRPYGSPVGGCPERMGTQRVFREDGSRGVCVCAGAGRAWIWGVGAGVSGRAGCGLCPAPLL